MSFKSLLLFCIVCFAASCKQGGKGLVYDTIDTGCKEQARTCRIDLKASMKFDWDKLYVFDYTATLEEVNSALGIRYPFFTEFSDKIVFLKGNAVVYHEDVPVKFDGIDRKGGGELVYFPIKANEKYFTTASNATVFEAKKDKNNLGAVCFYLNQIPAAK